MNLRERLLGAWELIDGKMRSDTTADFEFSPQRGGRGLIIYSASGYMAVTLSKAFRAPFASGQLDGGTNDEKAQAYSTYMSYTGSFEVDEKQGWVTHRVRYASFPNFVGQSFVRYPTFSGPGGQPGDEVCLNTQLTDTDDKIGNSYLTWRKL